MFAAPVSEIASPTLMSAFGAADTNACVADACGVEPPPQAATTTATVIDATANRRALIVEPPRGRDRAILANVERFAHSGLATAGCRPAGHHVQRAADGDHTEAMARGRQIRAAHPLVGIRVKDLDLLERSERLLSAGDEEARADGRRAEASARRRRVGHRSPRVGRRVVALEHREVLQQRQPAAAYRAHTTVDRGCREVIARRRNRSGRRPAIGGGVVHIRRADQAIALRATDEVDAAAYRDGGALRTRRGHRRDLPPTLVIEETEGPRHGDA